MSSAESSLIMQESFFKQGASTCLNLILELFSFLDRGVTCDTRGVADNVS